jgi:PAS domain S-box-containing protein
LKNQKEDGFPMPLKSKKTASKKAAAIRGNVPKDVETLVQELETHQVELEMQNQELRKARQELEESHRQYVDLFDFAPISYFVLDRNGIIQSVNYTGAQLVGRDKYEMISLPFSFFILKDDWEIFFRHLGEVFEKQIIQSDELRAMGANQSVIYLQLQSVIAEERPKKQLLCRTAIIDITARKLAEKALQEKQEELIVAHKELNTTYQELQSRTQEIREYTQAVTLARDEAEKRAAELDATISSIAAGVIIYDNFGNIIRINELARKIFGYSNDDFNLPYREQSLKLKIYNSDGTPYCIEEEPLNRALRGEIINNEEMMIPKAAEKLVWISATVAPIFGYEKNLIGVILIFNDISEQKRKTEFLLASERELLKVTINSLREGVVAIDNETRINFLNEAATNLTGYSQDEAIGEVVNKILYVIDDKTGEPLSVSDPQKVYNHSVLVTRDLREVSISINSSPILNAEGRKIGTVLVIQDITEKQKTEQEMLKAAKLESLGILAGGVAHDFNNILAGILANLQLANLKLQKRQDISKHMESTIEITRKASDLTKQLLTFAKGGDPVKKAVSITNLVKDTVQFTLSGSKIKPDFQFLETLWVVDIDQGQIAQVINNLIINAKQAMPAGGILEIRGENVVFETTGKYNPGRYVKLSIKDRGSGIPPEIIDKIFDPFFTTKKTGNGLGLSTSYSIIKKHDGYLEVESTPGIGTTFAILLPVSTTGETLSEVKNEIAASGEAKILLMDDEDTIRNIDGEMLASFGYLVSLAKDGQEAVELYQKAMETGEPFDAVIMDLTIPGGLGGIETMAILRRIDPEIKAIISSGYASDPVMSEYAKYGFSGVVTKPYKFDELLEVLNKVLDRKQLPLDFTF